MNRLVREGTRTPRRVTKDAILSLQSCRRRSAGTRREEWSHVKAIGRKVDECVELGTAVASLEGLGEGGGGEGWGRGEGKSEEREMECREGGREWEQNYNEIYTH